MDPNFLDFEQPIAELQAKISELRYVTDDSDIKKTRFCSCAQLAF